MAPSMSMQITLTLSKRKDFMRKFPFPSSNLSSDYLMDLVSKLSMEELSQIFNKAILGSRC